jgi:hypothetical protein
MRCTECDLTMNRHAEKPLRSIPLEHFPKSDSIAEEFVIASIHCCPGCGKIEAVTELPGIKPPRTGMNSKAEPRER